MGDTTLIYEKRVWLLSDEGINCNFPPSYIYTCILTLSLSPFIIFFFFIKPTAAPQPCHALLHGWHPQTITTTKSTPYLVTPRSHGTETLLRHIYVGQKYPHIYTLSISTGNNQSTKACSALYILTYEYNYKVITGCDIILQEYYITNRYKCDNTTRYTIMNCTKSAHESQNKNSKAEYEA